MIFTESSRPKISTFNQKLHSTLGRHINLSFVFYYKITLPGDNIPHWASGDTDFFFREIDTSLKTNANNEVAVNLH